MKLRPISLKSPAEHPPAGRRMTMSIVTIAYITRLNGWEQLTRERRAGKSTRLEMIWSATQKDREMPHAAPPPPQSRFQETPPRSGRPGITFR